MVLSGLMMAGCQMQDEAPVQMPFQPAQQPFPPAVMAALPGDQDLRQVFVKDGCYFYEQGGQMLPVSGHADNGASPICVG
ncbi:hypothetical protein CLV78_109150 [Aliiruegeria haliotis]|uniref:Uncharacterized protein n=1 Tax=Aliiruegeria haliotis TaxID=1280846 RepID=A0A2T0RK84_9RHOB|nr:hypothetical protein [Aliiruegeria haliotis]PRY21537.1 hypothetical protein CLV78_109150 [Aliiruegeria haliotis]